jgi:hypothetical protein
MALVRLALRVDGRFLLAALGLAAAMLVPLAGVLATAGLQPRVGAGSGTVLLADGPEGLAGSSVERATWVLSGRDDPSVPGQHLVAYTKGPALVGPGQADDGGPPGRAIHAAGRNLTAVSVARSHAGPGLVLVHPSVLGPATAEAAGFAAGGAGVPARGADAFESAGIAELKGYTAALTVVSLPLVVLVAAAFARLEARSLAPAVAVVSALGRPERGGQILTLRALLLAAAGAALALAAIVGGLWLDLLPGDRAVLAGRGFALGLAVPTFAAAVAGSAVGWATVLRTRAALRERGALGGEGRLGWLPLGGRPLIAGWRLAGVLLLVGAVVALDVGLPLAASGVPAALAGEDGEWVVGAESSSVTAGRARKAPADVMAHDPAIGAIVAEAFVPTMAEGKPFVLRGGEWDALARYHGLRLVAGGPPGPAEAALGARGAEQTGLSVGDTFVVPGEGGRLGRFTVSGLFEGGGLLEDEGVVALADAQRLAGLPADTVHAVRLRPQTLAALAAMEREQPQVEVLGLQVVPFAAPAGTLATVLCEVVNLSGVPGARVLNLRIDGEAVSTMSVSLPAYGRAHVELPFLVPLGAYRVEVNPEGSGIGQAAARAIEAPSGVVSGSSAEVRLLDNGQPVAGATLGLYANGTAALSRPPLQQARTDADGRASFRVDGQGLRVVAVVDGEPAAAEVYAIAPADAGRTRIVVEAAYTVPASPQPGQPATAAARVRNVGGEAGGARIAVAIDGAQRGYQDVNLGPGEAGTVAVDYLPRRAGEAVSVGGVRAIAPSSTAAPGPRVGPGNATAGETLQGDVANRLLGNARAVLGGLALTAAASAVAVLLLSARRTLAARSGVVSVLATVWTPAEIRRRAAVEGAVLGAIGGAGGVLLAKGFLVALASWTTVRAFGHALGDPFSPVFMLQVGGTMAFLAALTLHNGVARRLEGGAARALRSGEALE